MTTAGTSGRLPDAFGDPFRGYEELSDFKIGPHGFREAGEDGHDAPVTIRQFLGETAHGMCFPWDQ
jgi:hypothetical protein